MHVPFAKIEAENLIPKHHEDYVDVGLVSVLEAAAWDDPLILKGPKGTGKTLALEQYCAKHSIPLVRINCNAETDTRDLIGTYLLRGREVFCGLGAMPAAIETANEIGGAVLCLEEVNTIRPEMHSAIFSMTDYRQNVEASVLGKIFNVSSGCQVWVVGTMNPGYGGTYDLNEALRSRFDFIEVNYMSTVEEKRLLEATFKSPPSVTQRRWVDAIMNLAKETRSGKWEYALSTRDLTSFVRKLEKFELAGALKILEAKFDADFLDDFRARVESAFRVNLQTTRLYGEGEAQELLGRK